MKQAKFLIIFVLSIFSCGDSNNYIRNVYVDVEIDLSLPEFSNLNTVETAYLLKEEIKRNNYLSALKL